MKTKTIKVEQLRNDINEWLANSEPELVDVRQGYILTLEYVLHSTGNYAGFSYLDWNSDSPKDMDMTRRFYF
jgi:hypothetical protein